MSPHPTLIFVHGAWHTPEYWSKVIPLVEARSYKCLAVALPSVGSTPPTPFADDIAVVRNAIEAELSASHDVVLILHSYGGMVGCSAIKDLPTRRSSTTSSGAAVVRGIILLDSFLVPTGVTFWAYLGNKPAYFWTPSPERGVAVITSDPVEALYSDLPADEAASWAAKLQPHSLKSLTEGAEHVYAGYMDVPVWYLVCHQEATEGVSQLRREWAEEARREGADFEVREMESSHSPMLSRPGETAEFMLEALRAFEKE